MNQTVLEYDRPFSETIYTGPATRLSVPATETIVTKRIVTSAPETVERRAIVETSLPSEPEPLLSVDHNLKPLLPRRLPPREVEAFGQGGPTFEETVAETKKEIVIDEIPMNTIRDLVSTEQTPKLLSDNAGEENIFKNIMIPRDIPVRTTVSKPPRSLPPSNSSIPTPPRPIELPDTESVPRTILEPPPQPLILGQTASRNPVEDILRDPPPHPEGAVDLAEIDAKLTDAATTIPLPIEISEDGSSSLIVGKPRPSKPIDAKNDQWVSGALLLTTIIASMMACYAVVLAFEFRQRWLLSVTEQNSRFSMASFDGSGMLPDGTFLDGMESYGGTSVYGTPSDGLSSGRYGGEILEPSLRY